MDDVIRYTVPIDTCERCGLLGVSPCHCTEQELDVGGVKLRVVSSLRCPTDRVVIKRR